MHVSCTICCWFGRLCLNRFESRQMGTVNEYAVIVYENAAYECEFADRCWHIHNWGSLLGLAARWTNELIIACKTKTKRSVIGKLFYECFAIIIWRVSVLIAWLNSSARNIREILHLYYHRCMTILTFHLYASETQYSLILVCFYFYNK